MNIIEDELTCILVRTCEGMEQLRKRNDSAAVGRQPDKRRQT